MKGPQTLFQTGALGPGANLWIVPSEEHSEWNKKLDWYLNFQISKALDHQPQKISPDFQERLKDYDIQVTGQEQSPELLMISCSGLLPSKMLVIVPYKENYEQWMQSIHKVWLNLLKPTVRIFLPQDFPVNDFTVIWPDKTSIPDITLVPSQKSH